MRKTKKHLTFYKKYLQDGIMPHAGLCRVSAFNLIDMHTLNLFKPTKADTITLRSERQPTSYWGYEVPFGSKKIDINDLFWQFTTLRQTIVLFMAAIHNEL